MKLKCCFFNTGLYTDVNTDTCIKIHIKIGLDTDRNTDTDPQMYINRHLNIHEGINTCTADPLPPNLFVSLSLFKTHKSSFVDTVTHTQ